MEPARNPSAAGPVRAGLVVLSALLTEVVVIGAASNQWVSVRIGDQIAHSILQGGSPTARDFKEMLLTFNWRFAPRSDDHQHIWLSQVLMVATLLLVTGLVLRLLLTGPGRFGRVLFAGWTTVLFATVLGAYVRGLVNGANTSSSPRVTQALFDVLGPNTVTVLTGVILGLVVGVVAGVVAVVTRRDAGPATATGEPSQPPYVAPEQPPPFFGEPGVRPWQERHGPPGRHTATPVAPGEAPSGTQPTTRLPEPPPGGSAPPTSPPGGSAPPTSPPDGATTQLPPPPDTATTRFPRPPDDDFGHV